MEDLVEQALLVEVEALGVQRTGERARREAERRAHAEGAERAHAHRTDAAEAERRSGAVRALGAMASISGSFAAAHVAPTDAGSPLARLATKGADQVDDLVASLDQATGFAAHARTESLAAARMELYAERASGRSQDAADRVRETTRLEAGVKQTLADATRGLRACELAALRG